MNFQGFSFIHVVLALRGSELVGIDLACLELNTKVVIFSRWLQNHATHAPRSCYLGKFDLQIYKSETRTCVEIFTQGSSSEIVN